MQFKASTRSFPLSGKLTGIKALNQIPLEAYMPIYPHGQGRFASGKRFIRFIDMLGSSADHKISCYQVYTNVQAGLEELQAEINTASTYRFVTTDAQGRVACITVQRAHLWV